LIVLDDILESTGTQFEQEDSRIILLMPRYPTFAGRLFGKLLRRSEHIRVKLDEQSSCVWNLIDGKRTVRQIGEEIKSRYGESIEPLYPRLVEFLEILLRNKFVRISAPCEVLDVDG
jgi:hypothetical protein